jgi:two-component system response regulator AdeR
MPNELILIVEDERQIAEVLGAYLARDGFRVVQAGDGQTALDHHLTFRPDLVLLDLKLPKRDGFDVLAELRRRGNIPVIVVSALNEDVEKLAALRVGADDYIVKPFNTLEVVARVHSVLRRSLSASRTEVQRVGSLEIDGGVHAVRVLSADGSNKILELTLTEFRLITHMARAPRRAFARSELIDACLPESEAMERTVDSHISNLRRKISSAGGGEMLETIRGIGYRLEPLT